MKAKESPEKIYLRHNHKGDIGASWLVFPLTNNDIEYTRTDGFVEKAANWLRCHPSSHYDDLEEFANAFKKAMKLYD